MTKHLHGTVSISADKEWLRIRIPKHLNVPGQLWGKYVPLGLKDDAQGRARAKRVSGEMEADIVAGEFDETLARYKQHRPTTRQPASSQYLTVTALMERYREFKKHTGVSAVTVGMFGAMSKRLIVVCGNLPVDSISVAIVDSVCLALQEKLSPEVQRRYLGCYATVWSWGIERKYVRSNPWTGASKRVKQTHRKRPQPFTAEEMIAILEAFRTNGNYNYYYPLVCFLFTTGVRPGEALALRWENVRDNCSTVIIVDSLDKRARPRGRVKTPSSIRALSLPPSTQDMLLELRLGASTDYVFPGPRGALINQSNFNGGPWKTVVKSVLGDEKYRPNYHTRHTALSRFLHGGMSLNDVSSIGGTSLKMLDRHYVGAIHTVRLPEL